MKRKEHGQHGEEAISDKVTTIHGTKRPLEDTADAETEERSAPLGPRGQLIPDRCHYFLQKKRRYCRSKHIADLKYCTEHAHTMGLIVSDFCTI